MDGRGGLSKTTAFPLNTISRDDFLLDNDSSNDSAPVTKGLKSLIKEQSQSTLGISLCFPFFPLFFPRTHLSLKPVESGATSEPNLIVGFQDVNKIPFQIKAH